MTRPLMVLGCTSDAGKSLLVTALCRWFRREGVDVAPFKAQNMSNNARVVAGRAGDRPPLDGGEIGVAQWLQAAAAGVEPDVRMNPILVKPEADTRSQVIVRGRADRSLSAVAWQDRHDAMWEPMASSFDDLAAEHDLVILEGAGSPAEINLRDQVNNRMLEYVDAVAILVSDIDRGGSFAHLFGTWSLVPDATRDRLHGFVLNRFRGDAALLEPGPSRLSELTGMRALGVLPMLDHDLPREEGATETRRIAHSAPDVPQIVLPRLPFGSNLDEFRLLPHVGDVTWTTDPASMAGLDPDRDLIVLPGSKHVVADLAWLRTCGFDRAVRHAVDRGVRVVGVCGGAMMLGRRFHDPSGIEGARSSVGPVEALGLLDLETEMAPDKHVTAVDVRLGSPWWSALGSAPDTAPTVPVRGYEIRYGEVRGAATPVAWSDGGPVAWADGRVIATTAHGLFEDPAVVESVVGPGRSPIPLGDLLDATFDQLADAVGQHLDMDALSTAIGV